MDAAHADAEVFAGDEEAGWVGGGSRKTTGDRVQCGRVALHQRSMPGWHWLVDHKVVVDRWVAAIAPGPLPSYVTGLAPPSQSRSLPHRRPMEWTTPRLAVAQ
jgi:hypothetical protein